MDNQTKLIIDATKERYNKQTKPILEIMIDIVAAQDTRMIMRDDGRIEVETKWQPEAKQLCDNCLQIMTVCEAVQAAVHRPCVRADIRSDD